MYLIPDKPIRSQKLRELKEILEKNTKNSKIIIAKFWKEIEFIHTPLIETIEDEPNHFLVTFLYRNPIHTSEINVQCQAFGKLDERKKMIRLLNTDIYYKSIFILKQSRLPYWFQQGMLRTPLDLYEWKIVMENFPKPIADPYNPNKVDPDITISVLEMPDTPPQKWYPLDNTVPKGKIVEIVLPKGTRRPKSIQEMKDEEKKNLEKITQDEYSEVVKQYYQKLEQEKLNAEKKEKSRKIEQEEEEEEGYRISIYLPVNFSIDGDKYPFGVFFDGDWLLNMASFHIENVFNRLIAKNELPPMIFALIHQKNRNVELLGDSKFITMILDHLIPTLQSEYNVSTNPKQVVIGGMSFGGLMAMYMGFHYATVFGNVLSQSGSFWAGKRFPPEYKNMDYQFLIREIVDQPPADINIFMEIGSYEGREALHGIPSHYISNFYLRDILKLKGYNYIFREFPGDHSELQWRESIAEGLIALMGKSR